jgi:steroid 5-alpha reductase family enzyme
MSLLGGPWWLTAPLLGWAAMALVMGALWWLQRRTADAGLVDVGWTAGVGALAVCYASLGDGPLPRRVLVAVMAGLWSLRLLHHLLSDRVLKGREDGRYHALREAWGDHFQARIFWFFQAQAPLAVLFSLPALVAVGSARPALDWLDAAGALLWLVAWAGEAAADRQLAGFRSNPANRGRTCRVGLWRYSRHPNYFFEWLGWWSYALVAAGASGWWITLAAPMLMLLFVLKITGIPPTEARALASRGDDYRAYQRTTSAFIPWFPKREEAG